MKKFVVSFISFHNNDLKSVIMEAENKIEAIMKSPFFIDTETGSNYIQEEYFEFWKGSKLSEEYIIQELKDFVFNCDQMFEIIELPE